jgi:hypothetical protein
MQQIPTPQLIRIPPAPLVPLAPGPEKSNDIWEQFLRVQIKPTTQQTYRRAILRFCQENASGQSPSHFLSEFLALPQRDAIQMVLEWRQSQIDAGLASATINQRLAAIRSLVDFANRAEICSYSLRAVKSLRNQSLSDDNGNGGLNDRIGGSPTRMAAKVSAQEK